MSGSLPANEMRYMERGEARLAYRQIQGRRPGVVFCSGFRSDMSNAKAAFLEDWAQANGHAYLRFDYQGHGASSGVFADGCIGTWFADALAVFDHATSGPQIVVGSSMGGWMALLLALARPERVAGLIGIAAAPDFTEALYWSRFTDEQKRTLDETGVFEEPRAYRPGLYQPVTRLLIEEGRAHLLLNGPIVLPIPIRLMQGQKDPVLPWTHVLRLAERLSGDDVRITLIKDGVHQLARPQDLQVLRHLLEEMIVDMPV